MIVKLIAVKDVKQGKWNFKELECTKEDGSAYSKRIAMFPSNKELLNKLAEVGIGSFIELKYDDTQYKNINDIRPASGFPEKALPKQAGGMGVRRADGTSRGDDTNRSAAIYLAENIMDKYDPATGETIDEYLANLMYVATRCYDYIADGVIIPQINTEQDDSQLDPPEIDD